ncbi:hypothetical protein SPRG_00718 [Saprolegnia parasitica CBS 223.65]|uniref:sphingomyelin phosphodiesterase n=1 Tax=Saprolegnia parasitica (strain CBS 223.65) TaxID=695850 RepID=A0A067CZH4_SAPPC|nr:hypothetical protein SPRG_00718 [Saprolegnia parasitica CBS 223.65]KDO34655.1 hypothetical protein SPRG_00718 [Saprolegnia parasitica CBS 223.65]|eukprot:XP_012194329.1 hypothetical protein SPRG_00718 [Saprolegnia parasitica CBS 223.65]
MATARVLSLNVFMRPPGIAGRGGDHKDLRLRFLKQKIADYDIVCLQELFVGGSGRQPDLVRYAAQCGLAHHAGSVYPSLWSRKLMDGGLLILSRYPIVRHGQWVFTRGRGSDGVCAKGVVYAQLQVDASSTLHVFTTHTQAGEDEAATAIRMHQLRELAAFVHATCACVADAPILIAGDFNLDARHDPIFSSLHAPRFQRCEESAMYTALRGMLEQRRWTLVDALPHHGVTNGNGHGCLRHTMTADDVDRTGKCIDYIFLLQSPISQTTGVTVASAAVDPCRISDTKDGRWPFSHLSDHWALVATLQFPVAPAPSTATNDETAVYHAYPQPRAWLLKAASVFLLLGGQK